MWIFIQGTKEHKKIGITFDFYHEVVESNSKSIYSCTCKVLDIPEAQGNNPWGW
ncbi:hypothetical protein AQPE_0791 [Aquipluma nitroreducens]|uniref:Uncharacterized protein n=1 Tax=Aquipluma nitroreducens TaxID=2010828 RepID=A0A5K7S510_9BACT|nr:hypothetical protein AQPE_0791 [Aquipluma nitroreducens]